MSLAGKWSLRDRILMVALVPTLAIVGLVTAFFLVNGARHMDEAIRTRALSMVSFLAPASEYGVLAGNRDHLTALLQALLAQPEVLAGAVLNEDRRTMAVSGRPLLFDPALLEAVRGPAVLASNARVLAVAAPVELAPVQIEPMFEAGLESASRARILGWVYVEFDLASHARRKQEMLFLTLTMVAAALVAVGLLAMRLAGSVSHALGRLAWAVGEMRAGKLGTQVVSGADSGELRALEDGFNAMARAIADSHLEMQARVDEATAMLAHQAHHDPLTGLPNRRRFEQALESAVLRSRRSGDKCVLCFIDLDRFKIVNDSCGHAAGDALLRDVSALIRARVREEDLVCRVGGDEFALLLHGCSRTDALRICEGLRDAVANYRLAWEGRRFAIGASIGMVELSPQLRTPADVLVAADIACYAAKRGGRNRVVEHQPGSELLPEAVGAPVELPPWSKVVGDDRLVLYAQPIRPAQADQAVRWFEVLLRYRDEGGRILTPAECLGHFEREGNGLDVDLWVSETALRELAAQGGPVRLGLNISRAALLAPQRYLDHLQGELQRHGLRAEALVLEMPLVLVEELPDESVKFVRRMRTLGCGLALERIGEGVLASLVTLQPDYLKVSVARLNETLGLARTRTLVSGLAEFAHTLGAKLVVSELEAGEDVQGLAAAGVDYLQGLAVGAPLPIGQALGSQAGALATLRLETAPLAPGLG